MSFKTFILNLLTACLLKFAYTDDQGSITIPNFIRFPYSSVEGPFMGIFLALSLPLELPDYNVFFSYNMEANYVLPQNETNYTYPPLVSKRSWDRKYFYDVMEYKMNSHGHSGRNCLLRAICETSLYSSEHTGILGDILHIILTPSTSNDNSTDRDYFKAENYGKTKMNCKKYEKKCGTSFLNLISWVGHYLSN